MTVSVFDKIMKVLLKILGIFLASVRATNPRLGWIDVCSYSDPTGSSCCSPGMENKEYMVIPEEHDWFEHSVACR